MIGDVVQEAISRVRDRRRRFRQRLEDIFDRQTFVTLLFLGPAGKALEMFLLGDLSAAARFAAVALLGLAAGVYWHRLAAAAESAGDAIEEATGQGE